MRLIDADELISNLVYDVRLCSALLDENDISEFRREHIQFDKDCKMNAIEFVREEQTVDAVPVIRCKDCKYWDSEITQTAVPNMRSCLYRGRIGTLGIDYCSRAVRKEE